MPTPTTLENLKLGDTITLIMHGAGVIPTITSGKLIGRTTGENLANPGSAATSHANVFAYIPNDDSLIPNDYSLYSYLVIKRSDDSIVEIGEPWVDPVGVQKVLKKVANVVIQDFDEADRAGLLQLLAINGYSDVTIGITEVSA